MKISNRMFTYPVLADERNDYKSFVFKIEQSYKMNVSSLNLSFEIELTCPELEQMILAGKAEYVIHLECSNTAYREIVKSISSTIEYSIPLKKLNGTLECVGFIVLKQDIKNFKCNDWDDDFADMRFDLTSSSILAYCNINSLEIKKNYEEFTDAESIFTIYEINTAEHKPAEIQLDSQKIRIGLPKEDYKNYVMYSINKGVQALYNSMLILPALVYMLDEVRCSNGDEYGYESYKNKDWFIAIEKAYKKRGLNFTDVIVDENFSSFRVAQEIMDMPIGKAFSQIPMLIEFTKEED